jgi:large subunit ribosomal protein L24
VWTTGILPVEIAQARRLLAPQAGSLRHFHVMNRIKFHVKKGDNVEVVSGNFRGSSGKILQVLPKKQRVLIEGVRIIKKHLRKSQDNPTGKIAEREGPIHISNVRLIEKEEKRDKKKETKTKKEKAKS